MCRSSCFLLLLVAIASWCSAIGCVQHNRATSPTVFWHRHTVYTWACGRAKGRNV